ncbi:hypothetical protein BaRGS_00010017 [Batillaria attramentaria]|uniref:Uncharacterized protein n=1 Tax=Batillaria attramentaria TaxID=370345 RepID=A0ABD0LH17_9CAEN
MTSEFRQVLLEPAGNLPPPLPDRRTTLPLIVATFVTAVLSLAEQGGALVWMRSCGSSQGRKLCSRRGLIHCHKHRSVSGELSAS